MLKKDLPKNMNFSFVLKSHYFVMSGAIDMCFVCFE